MTESAIRAARPRAVAALTRYFRDLDDAEDAFQEASLRALRHWPEKGVPKDPTAWLILVGRNIGLDDRRRRSRLVELEAWDEEVMNDAGKDGEAGLIEGVDHHDYRDDLLRLLFTCCHPVLAGPLQVALALKVVAGLTVEEIAGAFLIKPKTMEQRLTRAKRRVAAAEIPYDTPSKKERTQRLRTVQTVLYLLFNEGYFASGGDVLIRRRLCEEAIRLARLLLRLFPRESESMGLLSLCLLQHARHDARVDPKGELVLLEDQDRALWDRELIAEGRVLLEKALFKKCPGPFQVQAAIAAVHGAAAQAVDTDWAEIERLYAILEGLQLSPVVTLNRAVALSKARGPEPALALVESLDSQLDGYLHFHGVRGALLAELGRHAEASAALEHALALARTPADAAHLRQRLEEQQEAAGLP